MHEKIHFLSYQKRRHDAENHMHIIMRTTSLCGVPEKWPVGLVTGSCHSLFFLLVCPFVSRVISFIYDALGGGGGGGG